MTAPTQTLTITMSGDPNDIHHFMWVLVHAGWDENRDSARVYDNTMYIFPKNKPAHRMNDKGEVPA